MLVPAACAVHCAFLPFLAGLLPFLGLDQFAHERLEWSIVGIAALIGMFVYSRAYLNQHRHTGPGLLFVVGLIVVVVTRLRGGAATPTDPFGLGIGGMFAATAHWMNLRLCRDCDGCAEPAR